MILKSAANVAPSQAQLQTETHTETPSETSSRDRNASLETARVPRRVPITQLNEYLTCFLCKGYFIDATTIIECLHSFCRGCIVKYLASNKYCPVCDVQVHKTKPLLNIRPDKTLQDIVYKLVPKLFQNEMQKRREFYSDHPETKPSSLEQRGEASYQHLLTPEETICISLNYHGGAEKSQRYLRCPAAVSVSNLQKLIRNKYDLSICHRVDVLHNQDCLNEYLTLIDISYIYLWRRKGPLALTYRIFEQVNRGDEAGKPKSNENNNNDTQTYEEGWKEVQLRISENGEMSVTGIQDCLNLLDANILNDDRKANELQEQQSKEKKEQVPAKPTAKRKSINKDKEKDKLMESSENKTDKDVEIIKVKRETRSGVQLQLKNDVETTKNTNSKVKEKAKEKAAAKDVKDRKRKLEENVELLEKKVENKKAKVEEVEEQKKEQIEQKPPENKQNKSEKETVVEKPVILNHSLGLQNLSSNHPLKKHALTPKNGQQPAKSPIIPISTSIATGKSTITSTVSTATATNTNNYAQFPNNRVYTPLAPNYLPPTPPAVVKNPQPARLAPPQLPKQSYKTLRDPPKAWNPQLPRPEPKTTNTNDLRNIRPAKFFKMRNNLPRYLGNPASGVKPMYQVHENSAKEKETDKKDRQDVKEAKDKKDKKDSVLESKKVATNEIKKHSIVKIDPKTLKPIVERAPEVSSLTTSANINSSLNLNSNLNQGQDLKINTSSVSIFNPLKLQQQAGRKSPHSPSNKSKSATSSPTTNSLTATSLSMAQLPSTPPSTAAIKQPKPLSFTPTNPFVPNLGSPTLSPNQFMYPPPAGFPSYDPMMMAAYQSFLVSSYHRTPFNYDLHKLQQQMGYQMMMTGQNQGQNTSLKSPGPREEDRKKEPSPKKPKLESANNNAKDKEKSAASSSKTINLSPKIAKSRGVHNKLDNCKQQINQNRATSISAPKTDSVPVQKEDIKQSQIVAGKEIDLKEELVAKPQGKETDKLKEVEIPGIVVETSHLKDMKEENAKVENRPVAKTEKTLQNALDKLTKAKLIEQVDQNSQNNSSNSSKSTTNSTTPTVTTVTDIEEVKVVAEATLETENDKSQDKIDTFKETPETPTLITDKPITLQENKETKVELEIVDSIDDSNKSSDTLQTLVGGDSKHATDSNSLTVNALSQEQIVPQTQTETEVKEKLDKPLAKSDSVTNTNCETAYEQQLEENKEKAQAAIEVGLLEETQSEQQQPISTALIVNVVSKNAITDSTTVGNQNSDEHAPKIVENVDKVEGIDAASATSVDGDGNKDKC